MTEQETAKNRPKRVKLTLSMTETDRVKLEELAHNEGVTMAGLIHKWIQEHAGEGRRHGG